jgi:protein-S-isoprenylcysteine O-methyltransferase Ste14
VGAWTRRSLRAPICAHNNRGAIVAEISGPIIGGSWIVFLVVWAILAMVYGGSAQPFSPAARAMRLLMTVVFFLSIYYGQRIRVFGDFAADIAVAGAVLCVLGLAFAIWARVALGRSWGMPMTIHAHPELVTSGPYRYVRHPIYTGLSAMLIGTSLVYPMAAPACAATIALMVYSARREERDMAQRFVDAYPKYKQHSKFLVPFVF